MEDHNGLSPQTSRLSRVLTSLNDAGVAIPEAHGDPQQYYKETLGREGSRGTSFEQVRRLHRRRASAPGRVPDKGRRQFLSAAQKASLRDASHEDLERGDDDYAERAGLVGFTDENGRHHIDEEEAQLFDEHSTSSLTSQTGESGEKQPLTTDSNYDGTSEKFLVTFDGPDDPYCPLNWSFNKKVLHTVCYALSTFCAQFGSTVMSPTQPRLAEIFHVSEEVTILTTTLYMLGIGFGPMLFAPLSEVYGRKVGVLLPFFLSAIFSMATARSYDLQSIFITRFFSGLFASAPVVSSGGVLADIYLPAYRGVALVFYAVWIVAGPTVAPVICSLIIHNSPLEWRWSCYFSGILSFFILSINVFLVSETYHPVLLARKASKLRHDTGNWAYHARHDEWQLTLKEMLTVHFMRPLAMLATPIVLCLALYASFVFGLVYIATSSVPWTFEHERGWSGTVVTLPALAVSVGSLTGGAVNVWGGLRYAKLVKANGGKALPEQRLVTIMCFNWLLPVGLFIFAWTSTPECHWIAPVIGLWLTGIGFFVIFQGCLNYLVDAFSKFAASAVAANTLTRSIFGGCFPLFSTIMFKNLQVQWGATLLALIGVVMTPIPWIFYKFGDRIRGKNPYIKRIS